LTLHASPGITAWATNICRTMAAVTSTDIPVSRTEVLVGPLPRLCTSGTDCHEVIDRLSESNGTIGLVTTKLIAPAPGLMRSSGTYPDPQIGSPLSNMIPHSVQSSVTRHHSLFFSPQVEVPTIHSSTKHACLSRITTSCTLRRTFCKLPAGPNSLLFLFLE
jgi:hypothetical protein